MRKIILFLALAVLTGCASGVATAPYKSVIYVPKSANEVEIAIITGAASRNWSVQKIGPATLQVKRADRKRQVVADIMFSSEDYTMYYNSSSNMDYNSSTKTISERYVEWLNDLDLAIQKQLVK